MQLNLDTLETILTIFVVDLVILIGAMTAFWRWLRKPIDARVDMHVEALRQERDQKIKDTVAAADAQHRELKAMIETETERSKNRADGIGQRIVEVATPMHTLIGKQEVLEKQMQASTLDRQHIHERIGEMNAQIKTVADMVQKAEVSRLTELGEIRERMVRTETKIDLLLRQRNMLPTPKEIE